MDDMPRELSEFLRVKNDTSKFKTFRRALGFGSASRVVKRALQREGGSTESVALALMHKKQVSRARSEIRAAPLRVLAATIGWAGDLVRYARGIPTSQEIISDRLARKSEIRREHSLIKAAYQSSVSNEIINKANFVARRVEYENNSPLVFYSREDNLQNGLQARLLKDINVPVASRAEAVAELQEHCDAMSPQGDRPGLTHATARFIVDNGLDLNAHPQETLIRLSRPALRAGREYEVAASKRRGGAITDDRTSGMAYPPLLYLPPVKQFQPPYESSDALPYTQPGAMHQWPTAANPIVTQSALGPIAPAMQSSRAFAGGQQAYSAPSYHPRTAQIETPVDVHSGDMGSRGDAAGYARPAARSVQESGRSNGAAPRGYDDRGERDRAGLARGR